MNRIGSAFEFFHREDLIRSAPVRPLKKSRSVLNRTRPPGHIQPQTADLADDPVSALYWQKAELLRRTALTGGLLKLRSRLLAHVVAGPRRNIQTQMAVLALNDHPLRSQFRIRRKCWPFGCRRQHIGYSRFLGSDGRGRPPARANQLTTRADPP